MRTAVLLVFLTIAVSTVHSYTCACCFPNIPDTCETMAIDLSSCDQCTSFFCANHVKGCQGAQCTAICKSSSGPTSVRPLSSSTLHSSAARPRAELIICASFTWMVFHTAINWTVNGQVRQSPCECREAQRDLSKDNAPFRFKSITRTKNREVALCFLIGSFFVSLLSIRWLDVLIQHLVETITAVQLTGKRWAWL